MNPKILRTCIYEVSWDSLQSNSNQFAIYLIPSHPDSYYITSNPYYNTQILYIIALASYPRFRFLFPPFFLPFFFLSFPLLYYQVSSVVLSSFSVRETCSIVENRAPWNSFVICTRDSSDFLTTWHKNIAKELNDVQRINNYSI